MTGSTRNISTTANAATSSSGNQTLRIPPVREAEAPLTAASIIDLPAASSRPADGRAWRQEAGPEQGGTSFTREQARDERPGLRKVCTSVHGGDGVGDHGPES